MGSSGYSEMFDNPNGLVTKSEASSDRVATETRIDSIANIDVLVVGSEEYGDFKPSF